MMASLHALLLQDGRRLAGCSGCRPHSVLHWFSCSCMTVFKPSAVIEPFRMISLGPEWCMLSKDVEEPALLLPE